MTRLRIAVELRDAPGSPKEISSRIGEPLGSTAHHFRRLANEGLIELVRTRPARGATEHFYALSAELLDLLDKLDLLDAGSGER